jgi:hypothetical protein
MKVKVIQMLIRYLTGAKAGQTVHAPTNQNTQQLIDLGFAEAVVLPPDEEKRLRFPDATGRPMKPAIAVHKWLNGTNVYNGRPQIVLVTPLIQEAIPFDGEPSKAAAHYKAKHAKYLPIPDAVLAAYKHAFENPPKSANTMLHEASQQPRY